MHVFVRNPANIDRAKAVCNLPKSPPLPGSGLRWLGTNGICPYDAVDIIFLLLVKESVTSRIQRGNFLTLEDVQGVNARSTVPMSSQRVHITEEGSITVSILQLDFGIYNRG